MALYSLLRRAHSSAIRHLPLRAAHFAVCNAVSGLTFRSRCAPLLEKFSTATVKKNKRSWADDTLIRVIDSEIKSAFDSELHDCVVDTPDGFPFKIQDRVGQRIVVLEREYEEESIRVEVDLSNAGCEENGSTVDCDGENEPEPSIPVVITISKGNGMCLHFDARAFPDRFSIHGLSVKINQHPGNHLMYRGPAFLDLDENVQVAFHKYLEIRGLTSATAKFLLEYIISKDTKEYLRWLKNLKKFFSN